MKKVRGLALPRMHDPPAPQLTRAPALCCVTATLTHRLYSTQMQAELWRIAGKRACCRALYSLLHNRPLLSTESGYPRDRCGAILTLVDMDPRLYFGVNTAHFDESEAQEYAAMMAKWEECRAKLKLEFGWTFFLEVHELDEREAQAQAPSAIGLAVEMSRECPPVRAPPAPTIAPGAVPDAARNSGKCRHALSPLTNADC